jgi:hypothetical protein
LDAKLTTLLCEKNCCCEIQRSENLIILSKSNLAESSKEGCGSKVVGFASDNDNNDDDDYDRFEI